MPPAGERTVLVRSVPESFADCLVAEGVLPGSIDVQRARVQHAAYVEALRGLPCSKELICLPELVDCPDSVFIEDSACLLSARDGLFLLPGSAAPTRAGEAAQTLHDLTAHGFSCVEDRLALDGGDVLRIGDTLVLLGVSSRSGPDAVAKLAGLMPGVHVAGVSVGQSLHLKTVVTWVSTAPPSDGRSLPRGFLVCAETAEGRGVVSQILDECRELAARGAGECVCWLSSENAYAANTLQVGGAGSAVLMPTGYDGAVVKVKQMLALHGCSTSDVVTLDMSEFKLANGGEDNCFMYIGMEEAGV